MAKDDKKASEDWLPVVQGVGPPDPQVSRADLNRVPRAKTAESETQNSVLQCGQRTADNWDLGGNS